MNPKYQIYESLRNVLDLLFPPVCAGCDTIGVSWCETCTPKIKTLKGLGCDICGLPQEIVGVCDTCLAERPRFHKLRAWSVIEDPVRKALHKLKYRRDISLGIAFADRLIPFVGELNWPVDVVVPIPLGARGHKERGYNQVGMIAYPLALGLKLIYVPHGLARRKKTNSQVGLTREQRRENGRGAFVADGKVKGKNVLILDDVSTTGSTLSSGAEALFTAGAKNVFALAVARALPHHGLKHA